MKKAALFYLTDCKFGGFHTYTVELAEALKKFGYGVDIFKIGKTSETRQREFGSGWNYKNITIETATAIVRNAELALTTCSYHLEPTIALARAGAGLVLHDPTEFSNDLLAMMWYENYWPLVIRESNAKSLNGRGIKAVFIPHPYQRKYPEETKRLCAASLSRVDFDKNIDMIVSANQLLPYAKRCMIFGSENRVYTHHKLDAVFPEWRKQYQGAFPYGGAATLAGDYSYIVDMSSIQDDGGGTQYTFFEAWDGGAALVLNRSWLKQEGTLHEGENCVAVSDSQELVNVLHEGVVDREQLVAAGRSLMETHRAELIVPKVELYCWAVKQAMTT
jgi:hypothetical protein